MTVKNIKIKTLFVLQFVFLSFINAQTGSFSVYSSADSHVEGGTSSATNYSTETSFKIKRVSDASVTYNRNAFLKFDFPNIVKSNIGLVTLRMYCNYLAGSAFGIDLFNVSAGWNETTLTWDNAPALTDKIKSFDTPTVINSWNEVDITSNFIATTNTYLAFGLKVSAVSNTNMVAWNSKESSSNMPALVVVYKANKPSNFTATVKSSSVTELKWDTIACNADKYLIERKKSGSDAFEDIATVDKSASTVYLDEAVDNQYSYTYKLIAVNTGGINASPIEATVIGNKNMEYLSSTTAQPVVNPILAGTINTPLLRIAIQTSGPQSPISAKSFTVNTLGTTNPSDITNVRLYYTNSDSSFVNPIPFSDIVVPTGTENLELLGNQSLKEGMNYFWLTTSVSTMAVSNNVLDAQCTQLQIQSSALESKIPEVINPMGNRNIARFLTPARKFEHLTRALVAVNNAGKVFLSWRIFATDDNVSFNLYRNGIKINHTPISQVSNFEDANGKLTDVYYIEAISVNGSEYSSPVSVWANNYKQIKLNTPSDYKPGDTSIADLDGDGELDYVVKFEKTTKDNSQSGYTDPVFLHAYKLDGKFLWSINLGINIRAGAHYTQFMVYDLDGDGKAEVVCKTAPGTKDGTNTHLSNGPASNDNDATDYRNGSGYILSGPEYLTVFNGETGKEVSTVNYLPQRANPYVLSTWGDTYGNRVDRFLAGVAYFDSIPSVVMCRGYYDRSALTAWDFKNKQLVTRWAFDTETNTTLYKDYEGQGNHSLAIGDVDNDGKDEIVYGAMTIDHDGKPLYSTLFRHGDAGHLGDLDPQNPGLEYFKISESAGKITSTGVTIPGCYMTKAGTGEVLWSYSADGDIGRGVSADISAEYPGNESWAAGKMFDSKGNVITSSSLPPANFLAWWDGDPLREILNATSVSKWESGTLFTATGCVENNGTKSNPAISGDILGDWREEVVFRTIDNQYLRIFTTTIPTTHGIYTLLQDPVYRLSLVWQNVGYNQPPHTGFFLGANMANPPFPNIEVLKVSGSAINIVLPQNGKEYAAETPIIFAVDVLGISGIASEVVLYDKNNQEIGKIDHAPYYFSSNTLPIGEHTITAVAKDINNNVITSVPVTFIIGAISGIQNQQADDANVFVYPVPAKDRVVVALENGSEMIESISIVDISGRTIKHANNFSDSKTVVDITGFKSGVYYIKIKSSLNSYIKDFVVLE